MGNLKNRARKPSRKRKRIALREKAHENIVSDPDNGKDVEDHHKHAHDVDELRPIFVVDSEEAVTPVPSKRSASEQKFGKRLETPLSHHTSPEANTNGSGFAIFSLDILIHLFSLFCCPECKSAGLNLKLNSKKRIGSSICFNLHCPACLFSHEFYSSNPCKVLEKSRNHMEANVRLILAFRNLGIGYEGLSHFMTMMNMEQPVTKKNYDKILDSLHGAYMMEAEASMRKAAEEVKEKDGTCDIAASFDGTWQKPGHSSLNGVVSAISVTTGKVLDFEVKSKRCKACQEKKHINKENDEFLEWKADHSAKCSINHSGSSGSMEVYGVKSMFERSEGKNGLRYVSFIGDGDSSTYQKISKLKPYGEDVQIVKKECVGHVQKRLGTRLRKLKENLKNQKLCDGKPIGGRNRLTDKTIDTLQNYYGLAIRQNKNNLDGMKNDILAGLYHVASTDEHQQHDLCPKGENSWCGWQKDVALKRSTYKHRQGLPDAIVHAVLPVYQQLSKDELLVRCLDSYTQNPNESLNQLIWKKCPKKVYAGRKVVELCTSSAVLSFNEGILGTSDVFKRMGISPGYHCEQGMIAIDKKRLYMAKRKATVAVKMQRKRLRAIRKGLWDRQKEKEKDFYKAGAF